MEGLLANLKKELLKDKSKLEEVSIKTYLCKIEELPTSPIDFDIKKDSYVHMKSVELFECLTSKDWLIIQSYLWAFLSTKTLKYLDSTTTYNLLPKCPSCAVTIACKFCQKDFAYPPNKFRHQRICKKNPKNRQ